MPTKAESIGVSKGIDYADETIENNIDRLDKNS